MGSSSSSCSCSGSSSSIVAVLLGPLAVVVWVFASLEANHWIYLPEA